ncbi:hypothetical protein D9758_014043 [Tetrapyrgos nigripes]|uniref:Uncharacterized protein n=1 Tax=Tetrapyrgos nigripes TaxID=182062 RepID=A0A8H5FV48_9AGAR|nr:hypothetical protein D9758_014043 [Tetrapyrgos nigripes]
MKRTSLRKPPAMDLDLSFLSQRLASQEEEANEPTLNLGAETPALYSPSYSPTYSSGSGSSPSPPLLSSSDGYDDYGYEGHHKNKSVLHEYLREELQRAFLESPSVLAGAEGSGDFSVRSFL